MSSWRRIGLDMWNFSSFKVRRCEGVRGECSSWLDSPVWKVKCARAWKLSNQSDSYDGTMSSDAPDSVSAIHVHVEFYGAHGPDTSGSNTIRGRSKWFCTYLTIYRHGIDVKAIGPPKIQDLIQLFGQSFFWHEHKYQVPCRLVWTFLCTLMLWWLLSPPCELTPRRWSSHSTDMKKQANRSLTWKKRINRLLAKQFAINKKIVN